MNIFLFNRKLMWAVVPLVFWSIIVLFGALDEGQPEDGSGLSVKLERRGIRLPGRLISLTEDAKGGLQIELGLVGPREADRSAKPEELLRELPEGISVSYVEDEPHPGPDKLPPVISMQSGKNEPLEMLNGRLKVLIGKRFVIRISHRGLQISRKDKSFSKQDLLRELRDRRDGLPRDGMGGPGRDGRDGMDAKGRDGTPGPPRDPDNRRQPPPPGDGGERGESGDADRPPPPPPTETR